MIKENLIEQIKRQIRHLSNKFSLTNTDINKIEEAISLYNNGKRDECFITLRNILNYDSLYKNSATFKEIIDKCGSYK